MKSPSEKNLAASDPQRGRAKSPTSLFPTGKSPSEATHDSAIRDLRIGDSLLRWYDQQHRDLPWRHTKDPYAIWVSEIMLQQTRVEAVIPYYQKFLRRFPDLASLADATEDAVLAYWSGLGYYSRARNLRRGASLVRERFGGEFPRSRADALSIPGIGKYTSAAVLSIAYDEPHAVVDGNVARVLSRLFCLEPPEDSMTKLELRAQALLHPHRPGDHNQAMMELGATVCTPQIPRCSECPLEPICHARAQNRVDELPRTTTARAAVKIEAVALLLVDPLDRILLERGRWPLIPHLWLPPILELAGGQSGDPALILARWNEERIGLRGESADSLTVTKERKDAAPAEAVELRRAGTFSHAITHHRLRFRVIEAKGAFHGIIDRDSESGVSYRWVGPRDLESVGVSSILTKALRQQDSSRESEPRPF